jgi:membrane-bound inhibitor of C-type lysozyme
MQAAGALLAPLSVTLLVAASAPALAIEASYECSGGTMLQADFSEPGASPGQVVLALMNGPKIVLPQALSADGGRYAEGGTEFWIKGEGATFTHNGATENCRVKQ